MINKSIEIKRQRVLLYWSELSRHRVDCDVSLDFMTYMFSVKRAWIIRIVKTVNQKKTIRLEHYDLDCRMIDAFVEKLHRKAKRERTIK